MPSEDSNDYCPQHLTQPTNKLGVVANTDITRTGLASQRLRDGLEQAAPCNDPEERLELRKVSVMYGEIDDPIELLSHHLLQCGQKLSDHY